jgi:hypothetical protein
MPDAHVHTYCVRTDHRCRARSRPKHISERAYSCDETTTTSASRAEPELNQGGPHRPPLTSAHLSCSTKPRALKARFLRAMPRLCPLPSAPSARSTEDHRLEHLTFVHPAYQCQCQTLWRARSQTISDDAASCAPSPRSIEITSQSDQSIYVPMPICLLRSQVRVRIQIPDISKRQAMPLVVRSAARGRHRLANKAFVYTHADLLSQVQISAISQRCGQCAERTEIHIA